MWNFTLHRLAIPDLTTIEHFLHEKLRNSRKTMKG
jgi:hypothetical protein